MIASQRPWVKHYTAPAAQHMNTQVLQIKKHLQHCSALLLQPPAPPPPLLLLWLPAAGGTAKALLQ